MRSEICWTNFDYELVKAKTRIVNWFDKWPRPAPDHKTYDFRTHMVAALRQKYQRARGEGDEKKMIRAEGWTLRE